jgi:deoxyribodipyrimidine photolyase-like uncharacterized protein
VEDPYYFAHEGDLRRPFFAAKMIYQIACLREYYDSLPTAKKYINAEEAGEYKQRLPKTMRSKKHEINTVYIYDPLDYACKRSYVEVFSVPNSTGTTHGAQLTILDYPNFLLTKGDHINYYDSEKKTRFTSFYGFIKTKLNFSYKNTDTDNRKARIPQDSLNTLPIYSHTSKNTQSVYVREAKKRVKEITDTDTNDVEIIFPTNHKDALAMLHRFVRHPRIANNFSDFQDAIVQPESTTTSTTSLHSLLLFHSGLSPCLNNGLLSIKVAYTTVLEIHGNNKRFIDAFIRQYFWREFQFYCFINMEIYTSLVCANNNNTDNNNNNKCDRIVHKTNKLRKKTLLDTNWYDETSTDNFIIVNDAIAFTKKYGYLNHIWRLMVTGTTMLMQGISLHDIYRWHLEFACDSHEWVMVQNVYGMIGGMGNTTHKLYIHSSNYLRKMSDGAYFGNKDSKDSLAYDDLYYEFKKKMRI